MAESTYTFDDARSFVETLDALTVKQRKAVRMVTLTNPTCVLQFHADEVRHLKTAFTLDEVLCLVPGLQLDLLVLDLRKVTSGAYNGTNHNSYLKYWQVLRGLLEHSNGWKVLHFYPPPAMMKAFHSGVTGVPDGVEPKEYWNHLIAGRYQ